LIALEAVLLVVALPVSSASLYKSLMRTSLDNFSAFENQDLITLRIVESRCAITKVVRPVFLDAVSKWPIRGRKNRTRRVRDGKEWERTGKPLISLGGCNF